MLQSRLYLNLRPRLTVYHNQLLCIRQQRQVRKCTVTNNFGFWAKGIISIYQINFFFNLITVEKEKEVIIKVLPLPIPVGTPIPSPVHIGVPSISPFVNSQYSSYNSLPVFNGVGVAPRMDETDSEPIGTRRSADADHSILGGQFGNIDSHTHTTHHHTQSSHEHPQGI